MNRLTPLVESWGLNPGSVVRNVLLDPEGSKYVRVERRGKLHAYIVVDPEGLKEFLKRKGFPVREAEQ
ncbi:hypothetical protein [Thermovibrio sp.]